MEYARSATSLNLIRDIRRPRQRTLQLAMMQDDLVEYYNPETGACPPRTASTFSWAAAVFVDLVIMDQLAAPRYAGSSWRPAALSR